MLRTMKNVGKGTQTLKDLEYGKKNKTDNVRKWETHIVGPEIWQETLKNVQNEKQTLYDLEYG